MLAGTTQYDVCDICGGDGQSCLDCKGVPFGKTAYDCCDVCGGDMSTCADCMGVCHGTAEADDCGVCMGDGTSCLDCNSNCFTLARCYFPSLFTRKGNKAFSYGEKRQSSCKNC